jgi:hypothetical protein
MNYLKKSFSVALGSKAYRDNFAAAFGHEPDEDGPPAPDEVVDPDLTPMPTRPMPLAEPTPMPPADDDLGVEAVPAPDADLPARVVADAEEER